MRIAIFTDSYFPQINGVVTQIKNSSRELARRGHEIMIVAPSHNSKTREEEHAGMKVIYLPSLALPTYADYRISVPSSRLVKKRLKEFRPEIVHVHTPFGLGWMGLRYAKRHKAPVIGTYHTLLPEFMMYLPIPMFRKTRAAKSLAWKYTNFFYNKCSLVTTPSVSMKAELEKNGCKKVMVLPNAIHFDLFNNHAKRNYSSKKIRLLYFGRVGFEKNIEVLIFALRHLLKKSRNYSLSITGSGPAIPHLKNVVKDEKLSEHVHFHLPLQESELALHVSSYDVFVTASTIETQGLTILESMATGVPVVGADFLAIPDAVKNGKNGFLFKPFDFVDCAAKIEKLSKVDVRKKLGRNAIETAREYSLEKIVSEWEELYAKTVKTRMNK